MNTLREDEFTAAGKAGEPLRDCLVIDAHGHLGPITEFPYLESTPESLIRAMDRLGIDQAWVSSTWAAYESAERAGNDYVIAAQRDYPGRIFAYMALRVGYPENIVQEMERCYEAGVRAVKIFDPEGLPYNHPNYDALYAFAHERAMPILAHTWGFELDHLHAALEQYDRVKWLLGHAGAADEDHYVALAREYPHVYLETCFSQAPRGLIERFVEQVPLEKIIWGSDQLFMSAAHQIGRVLFAQITPAQKRAILGGNAAQVFGS